MYAIVEIAGQQFKVEKNDEIFVHRLDGEPGTKLEFTEVLLVDQEGTINVGKPYVDGSMITGKIIEHARGDKVIVFKKKRRKGFQKETGHRQDFSKILTRKTAIIASVMSAAVRVDESRVRGIRKSEIDRVLNLIKAAEANMIKGTLN